MEKLRVSVGDLVEDIWRDAQGRVTKDIKHWKEIRRDQLLTLIRQHIPEVKATNKKLHEAEIREIFKGIDKIVTQLISQGFIESEYAGFLKERVQALKSKHIKGE